MRSSPSEVVYRYHDGTKHAFHRLARSLGYLDWASQPKPFRAYTGAPTYPLYPAPAAAAEDYRPAACSYDDLFLPRESTAPLGAAFLGDLLRHALGLSAWKQYGDARWSLRVNPSSGNLHPTEAYLVCGPLLGISDEPAVYHYSPERHALEQRCVFASPDWLEACAEQTDVVLVVLSSVYWRESWKYGERAFRYCQHDLGHAIAALRLAAALAGWRASLLPAWSHRAIATIAGLDRDEDFVEAEREDPACLLAMTTGEVPRPFQEGGATLADVIGRGRWSGSASQLSEDHVEWTLIEDVVRATEDPGAATLRPTPMAAASPGNLDGPRRSVLPGESKGVHSARSIILQRRSAVAFDGRRSLDRPTFLAMLDRTLPTAHAPWDAFWWPPAIHLAIFVHRVDDLTPGLYLLPRAPGAEDALRAAMRRDFLWTRVTPDRPLLAMADGDCRSLARRLSCDQDIAADGFFSLGMLAAFGDSLDVRGAPFYRQLYWEAGAVGQVLYLEAEAVGARATGIGCFYDDPVHEALGLGGHQFQSLYHFTVGMAVDDARLTSAPGYEWELRRDGESDSIGGSLRNSSQA